MMDVYYVGTECVSYFEGFAPHLSNPGSDIYPVITPSDDTPVSHLSESHFEGSRLLSE